MLYGRCLVVYQFENEIQKKKRKTFTSYPLRELDWFRLGFRLWNFFLLPPNVLCILFLPCTSNRLNAFVVFSSESLANILCIYSLQSNKQTVLVFGESCAHKGLWNGLKWYTRFATLSAGSVSRSFSFAFNLMRWSKGNIKCLKWDKLRKSKPTW